MSLSSQAPAEANNPYSEFSGEYCGPTQDLGYPSTIAPEFAQLVTPKATTKPQLPPTFVYPPLRSTERGHLRLIKLEAPSKYYVDEEIRCMLVSTEPWKDGLQYECLSYCWGNVMKTKRIHITTNDGVGPQTLNITANLDSALRKLRLTRASSWLWIDAICINQDDLHERAVQVGFMQEIYKFAAGVIIWLGEGSPETALGARTISGICSRFTSATLHPPEEVVGPAGLRLSSEDLQILWNYRGENMFGPSENEAYRYVTAFFSLPWFRRSWVLQEAFSHSSIIVYIGKYTLPWGAVILAALWQAFLARDYTSIPDPSVPHLTQGYLPELWLGLLHTKSPRGLPMPELVCRARDFQATDPRDKIFAFLGVANDLGLPEIRPTGFRPNYTMSKREVYCAFAKDHIRFHGNLDILVAVDTFSERILPRGDPSWMPDLDVSIATIRGLGFPRKYNASFSTATHRSVTYGLQFLDVSGFIIDHVSALTKDIIVLQRGLKVCVGDREDALHILWNKYLAPKVSARHVPVSRLLEDFIHTITATGFASPNEFPEHPLGIVVPPHEAPSLKAHFAAFWSRYEPDFSTFPATMA
ncbi:heterokaryon incompatibility protein-domain-containing protein [Clohesyomyces aquaticus]|uniref:Heterokaryon incompatibility protein-domain-containing protein n=1 Tax=Clohesyomyces aquaticus TaxID=1231657 RepID=A0A1Y2ABF9_9PLEO|nr:heterokaryon incompatibility protein-domain-containing protein [Clohesyomyces aquaticus]